MANASREAVEVGAFQEEPCRAASCQVEGHCIARIDKDCNFDCLLVEEGVAVVVEGLRRTPWFRLSSSVV